MVEVTYQMLLSTIQIADILVGIISYIMTMRNSQMNQQMQLESARERTAINAIVRVLCQL